MNLKFRPLNEFDEPIVWQMLMLASHEPTMESVRSQSYLACYAVGWGRVGDIGFVALVDEKPIGAAWLRLWTEQDKGFSYIRDDVPELAMAVLPEHQGQGVGTKLLALVLQEAKSSFSTVSLNVRSDNPVVRLYERAGFVKVEGSEIVNRTGGVSFNMVISST